MKDYKLKLRNLRASHTLGWSDPAGLKIRVYYESIKRNLKIRCIGVSV